ncbi:hypothetical protein [Psychrobacter sp. WY6]|uniref:hypothetical protein n=1 Tax=Psychrobacter sp. WY6 TaxID=2708350 RepID=UPI002022C798|nr:hypothetical protein [Psychrobacter sp. WY6]
MVNDPSNIPARRRRAASQSDSVKQSGGSNNKHYESQQVSQDSHELAQLRLLSLANSSNQAANKRHHSKPAPLFVIEHEKVVPLLKKQLSNGDKPDSRQEAAQKKPAHKNVSAEKALKNQDASSDANSYSSKADSKPDRSNQAQQPKATQSEVMPSSVARSVARSPSLVSMNNEPIPHKRRRRQPSVDSINLASNTETQVTTNNDVKAVAKYAKKAPKPAAQPTNKTDIPAKKTAERKKVAKVTTPASAKKPTKATEAKSAKTSQAANGNVGTSSVNDNKGPIPSKRRRRQPSTDNV